MIEAFRTRFTFGGGYGGDATAEVHGGQLVVKRKQVVKDYPPRVRLSVGPGIGPHYTDDPDALRALAAMLEASAALLEKRQAQHADARTAEGLWC